MSSEDLVGNSYLFSDTENFQLINESEVDFLSSEEYGVGIIKDVMIPCRDGVRLVMDIFRPTKYDELVDEKFPTILERTPYNKERNEMYLKADYFVKHGYILAVQDCRGRFKSEGQFYMAANDPTDGFDAVEWIAKQPWSNGKIGTMGTSYGGWVQSGLALLNPPHLTAMFPNQSIFNAGLHSMRHAGALEMRFFAWPYWMACVSKEASQNSDIAKNLFETRFDELITQWPLKKGETPLRLVPTYEKFAFDILTHSDFDEFWRKTGIGWMGDVEDYIADHADVPMYYSGSWFDSYPRSTTEFYITMSKAKTNPVKLIMGPWTHGDAGVLARTYSGDVDFGPDAKIDYNALRLRWFDQTLKEIDTSILDEPPIKIFVMGGGDGHRNREGRMNHGGRWRYETEWPLARTDYQTFYLSTEGLLNTNQSDKEESSTSYVYDPKHPVPSIGGNHSSLYTMFPPPKGYDELENLSDYEKFWLFRTSIVKAGAFNQVETPSVYGAKPPYLPLSARHDVLVFQTPALEKDIEVTGQLKVILKS